MNRLTEYIFLKVLDELLLEAARIQHIEDIVFWEGSKGALRAVKSLTLLRNNVKDVSIKWDGSPAVIFGRNANGQFVLTDKSGFGAKSYNGKPTSGEELEKMFLGRGTAKDDNYKLFATSMRNLYPVFESAVPVEFRGYFKGDLLYSTTPKLTGGRFIFKPNIVTYSVSAESDLGRKISRSVAGVVIHRLMDESGNEYPLKNFDIFQGEKLLVIPPVTVQKPPVIDMSILKKLESIIKSNSKEIDGLLDKNILSSQKITDFPDVLYRYINGKVDTGLAGLGKDFLKWLEKSNVSDNKKKKMAEYVVKNSKGFDALWVVVTTLMSVKDDVVDQIDSQNTDVKTSIGNASGGEGYVLASPAGDIKLVSRSKFSAANRAMHRESVINEGGNVFKSGDGEMLTTRINKVDVIPTIKWLETITGLKLIDKTLGTTGIKSSSGDLDLAVDVATTSKEQLIVILGKWIIGKKYNPKEFIKKSGDAVHFKTPINGDEKNGFVQTDFMFGNPDWLKWSMHGEPDTYKGCHRNILLASIAKSKNFKWSYKNGLVDRATDKQVSQNPDEIARILLGPNSSEKDINSVVAILTKIKNDPHYAEMTADARETLHKQYNVDLP